MSVAVAHADEFYRAVAESGIVWGIKDSSGFPAPVNVEGERAMPFWSSESRAQVVIHNAPEYSGFLPVPIPWQTFCERWVPGLTKDGLLAGINWSGPRASGFDIAPVDLQKNVTVLIIGAK